MKRPLRLTVSALVAFAGAGVNCDLRAEDGMPALLQFAEQYQQQQSSTAAAKKTEPAHKPAATSPATFSLRRSLRERDERLARQEAELNALRQTLATMRTQKPKEPAAPALPDGALLQQWLTGLRQAWQGSPERSAALLQKANARIDRLEQQRAESETQFAQDRKDWQLKIDALQRWSLTPEQLAVPTNRLSYAAGSALGRDIQQLMAERQGWGVPVDSDSLLAGVLDTVSGKPLLPQEELTSLIAKADAMANTAREQVVKRQEKQDQDYVAQFSQQKGAKRSAMGFWYKVDYAGDNPLGKDAVIDVVVNERLTDGTVIQDMDLSGKVLSQPLSAYPPLFREAISQLNNHGSLTMVVPPELAYGETGYPPKVPPNATMVYQLRIDNSKEQ